MEESASTKFVVGLGNPEAKYEGTRHNIGFMVLGELLRRWDFGPAKGKFHSLCWTGRIAQTPVVLAAPQTYMNRSGLAVGELTGFYKVDVQRDLLIVMDDLALAEGRVRARCGGSAGGHNGLADILRAVGQMEVARLRIGIGQPPPRMDQVAFVLGRFDKQQEPVMQEAIQRAAQAVADWAHHGITYVMDHYNQDAKDVGNSKENGKE